MLYWFTGSIVLDLREGQTMETINPESSKWDSMQCVPEPLAPLHRNSQSSRSILERTHNAGVVCQSLVVQWTGLAYPRCESHSTGCSHATLPQQGVKKILDCKGSKPHKGHTVQLCGLQKVWRSPTQQPTATITRIQDQGGTSFHPHRSGLCKVQYSCLQRILQ